MRAQMVSIWVCMSAGVWASEWIFAGRHWGRAIDATYWIGLTCAYIAYKLRNYELAR